MQPQHSHLRFLSHLQPSPMSAPDILIHLSVRCCSRQEFTFTDEPHPRNPLSISQAVMSRGGVYSHNHIPGSNDGILFLSLRGTFAGKYNPCSLMYAAQR